MVDTTNAPREDYRNLWKLLIDGGIRKGELRDLAGLMLINHHEAGSKSDGYHRDTWADL